MIIIVCVDDKGGVAFNHRRQSRDKILIEKLVEMISEKDLYLSSYSAKLFEGVKTPIVCEDYLRKTPKGAYCFVEREELERDLPEIEAVILVKWNRVYPRDKVLKLQLKGFHLIENFDFVGSSHEKISLEVYEKIR